MIKTPVRFDEQRNLVYDSDGIFILDILCDNATALEVVKRINLHEELEEAFEYCLAFFEDRASSKKDLERVEMFNKLLEKCHE